LRDRTGKSARIAEKIKKKIGIDIVETKPEVLQADVTENKTEEKDLSKETKIETKKEVKSETKKESSEEKK
jgi:large subunit ribosomal protein L19